MESTIQEFISIIKRGPFKCLQGYNLQGCDGKTASEHVTEHALPADTPGTLCRKCSNAANAAVNTADVLGSEADTKKLSGDV